MRSDAVARCHLLTRHISAIRVRLQKVAGQRISPGTAPTASSADQKIVFTSNQDPVPVYLEPRDKVIAVIWVSIAGTCKFMTVGSRRPR